MNEVCECPTCGFQWTKGQHGGHLCTEILLQQLKVVKDELNQERTSHANSHKVTFEKVIFWKKQMQAALTIIYSAIGRTDAEKDAAQDVRLSERIFETSFPSNNDNGPRTA